METRARERLAQRLKVLRLMRAWSQEELAHASGLHRTYISLIERAECNVSLDNLERLAGAFEVNLVELLGPSDPARLGESLLASLARPIKRKE